MILIIVGRREELHFSSAVQLARNLASAGLEVAIDAKSCPEEFGLSLKYESVNFLTDDDPEHFDRILITGAQEISDEVLQELHRQEIGVDQPVYAIGSFENPQALIGSQSKLAYVLGREPKMFNIETQYTMPFLENALAPPVFSANSKIAATSDIQVILFVPNDLLENPHWMLHLEQLSNDLRFRCHVITQGSGKEQIRKSGFESISSYSYAELPPDSLGQIVDVAVFFGEKIPGARMAALALELMGQGGAVVDCTARAAFAATGAPAIRGPSDIAGLSEFLHGSILPNLLGIRDEVATNNWIQQRSVVNLLASLEIPLTKDLPTERNPITLFLPTNGVGLGHAQRCSLIAKEVDKKVDVSFAAFPSCIPLLQNMGFDCLTLVSKSRHHADPFANDLLNYRRLASTVAPGDHLVFDGGYIFDGVYRTILENQLSATWIRRGLWQVGQIARTPIERERAFDQVIVPLEGFDELNRDYSFGGHINKVGPIVQNLNQNAGSKTKIRKKLAKRFGRDFRKLIVTMLGGGIAADRTTQLQFLASQFDARPDCLHLIVVWPSTPVAANLFGWENTIVVRTHHALQLCLASDLVISAAGYNSFHELVYSGIPTIFIPQMAGYMDDQERRALAASDRGLAATVLSDQMLTLKRELDAFLEGGKSNEIRAALGEADLPATGNSAAARLIEGLNK